MSKLIARKIDCSLASTDGAIGLGEVAARRTLAGGSEVLRMGDKGRYPLCALGQNIPWFATVGFPDVLVEGLPVSAEGLQTMSLDGSGTLSVITAHDVRIGGATVSMAERARAAALQGIAAAQDALLRWDERDRARLRRWFGDDSEATRGRVIERLAQMSNALEGAALAEGHKNKGEGTIAHVRPDDASTIYLDPKFWNQTPATQGETLVHESSHFDSTAGTDDVVYGEEEAAALARVSPQAAEQNADNYAYFVGDP